MKQAYGKIKNNFETKYYGPSNSNNNTRNNNNNNKNNNSFSAVNSSVNCMSHTIDI